ncbi:MAG: molybdopterin-dependent oxidoreductase [Syntrophorhabdales bacterium]|jgi:DMSO/TMAO reductase YedYZ molybdopterin-dependent catalytic subunit
MNRDEEKESTALAKGLASMPILLIWAFVGMTVLTAALHAGDEPPVVPAKTAVNAADDRGQSLPGTCALAPLVVPPTPAKIPGYAELDPSTGLHVTGTMKEIDVTHYRLEVAGKVSRPLSLTFDELRCMPRVQARPTLICPGFFTDVATWAGTPLKYIVDLAGPQEGATGVRLTGADNYSVSRSLSDATAPKNFLAYEWEGKALPRLHGFPVRAIFPGLEGNQWVKWVVKIVVF